jgi:hypothetical protein
VVDLRVGRVEGHGTRGPVDYRKLIPSPPLVLVASRARLSAMFLDCARSRGPDDFPTRLGSSARLRLTDVERGDPQVLVGRPPGRRAVGGAPGLVQSMTTTKTADVDGTLAQIYALAAAGATSCAAPATRRPRPRAGPDRAPLAGADRRRHPLPVQARARGDGGGRAGLRLNPGNIRKPEHIKVVAREAKDRGLPIRIGVNAGIARPRHRRAFGGATPEALVASAQRELATSPRSASTT